MHDIKVEHHPTPERLSAMGVWEWPIWEKEVSEFPWTYQSTEVCYFLDGAVLVTPEGGKRCALARAIWSPSPAGLTAPGTS